MPDFKVPDAALFLLIDVDLYEPTKTILDWAQKNCKSGDLIYFDEAFDPWNEGKALREAREAGLKFRAIGNTGSALLIQVLEHES